MGLSRRSLTVSHNWPVEATNTVVHNRFDERFEDLIGLEVFVKNVICKKMCKKWTKQIWATVLISSINKPHLFVLSSGWSYAVSLGHRQTTCFNELTKILFCKVLADFYLKQGPSKLWNSKTNRKRNAHLARQLPGFHSLRSSTSFPGLAQSATKDLLFKAWASPIRQ